jgi:hypothetical protein
MCQANKLKARKSAQMNATNKNRQDNAPAHAYHDDSICAIGENAVWSPERHMINRVDFRKSKKPGHLCKLT